MYLKYIVPLYTFNRNIKFSGYFLSICILVKFAGTCSYQRAWQMSHVYFEHLALDGQ